MSGRQVNVCLFASLVLLDGGDLLEAGFHVLPDLLDAREPAAIRSDQADPTVKNY